MNELLGQPHFKRLKKELFPKWDIVEKIERIDPIDFIDNR